MKIVAFNLSGDQYSDGRYKVDYLYNADYSYPNHSEYFIRLETETFPSTISEEMCFIHDGNNYILDLVNDDDIIDNLRAMAYENISNWYKNYSSKAIYVCTIRDISIPMTIGFDDVNMLENGWKVLSDFNDEENCFIKDSDNKVIKCSINELESVLKQCRYAAMYLWKYKVEMQNNITNMSSNELKNLRITLPNGFR